MSGHERRAHILVVVEALPHPLDVRVIAEVEAFRAAGYEVTVIGPADPGFEALDVTIDGVRVLRFRRPPTTGTALGYLREYGRAFPALARLAVDAHRERPVDVVFVCPPPDALAAVALAIRRAGARIVIDQREISPELFAAKFGRGRALGPALGMLLRQTERLALRHADAVVTVSAACAELLRDRDGVAEDRVFLVGNGPDPRRIFPVEPRAELRRGRDHLVLWLGAMSRQEGLEHLIEAADHLVNGLGRADVSFALVGPGDVHAPLREHVRRLGLEDVVAIEGLVGDDLVRAYMSTADVCVGVDARNDMNDRAAMRKVLEYMATGRPVVQFPLAEMRRLCGDATLYARDGDPRDLADRIAWLLDRPQERARLGAAARERVTDGLMWPDQVPALLAAIGTALDGRRPEDRRRGPRRAGRGSHAGANRRRSRPRARASRRRAPGRSGAHEGG
jgi:glycosyltransferase involved in cell wall biosynthesis